MHSQFMLNLSPKRATKNMIPTPREKKKFLINFRSTLLFFLSFFMAADLIIFGNFTCRWWKAMQASISLRKLF